MSRLLWPALLATCLTVAMWAVSAPDSDLPNASEDTRPTYQGYASQEPAARGYLTSRYVPLATATAASTPEPVPEPLETAVPERPKFSGLATWYGAAFHGNHMRSGKRFDMYDDTIAAANLWPLGSALRVTNEYNGVTIDVVVQDTGGFRSPVLVDLSYAAFGLLDRHSRGVIPVVVEVISEGD